MITNELKLFAAGNTEFYEAAMSYFASKDNQTAEKKALMNEAYFSAIEGKSKVSRADVEMEAWINHPVVAWASFAILEAAINAIIPQTILPQFAMFADMRETGYGNSVHMTIQPNQMYTVSRGSHAQRVTLRQRHFKQDIFVTPVEHIISIYENLYSVLAGRTDIADFMGWVVLSVQTEMYKDALNALVTGITGTSAFAVSGAFSLATLLELCEKVQAKNGGVKPVIAGSATALLNVVPDASNGYRVNIDGNNPAIELIKTAFGYPVLRLDNAIDGNNALVLPTDKLFVIVPAGDKLLKGAIAGGLTNGNDAFKNSDLTVDYTFRKDWDFVYASAAKGGSYTITA